MNDFLIMNGDLNIINDFNNKLSERFYITDLELVSYYLSMFVTQTRDSINLNQMGYLKRVLLQFAIDICKVSSLLISPRVPNSILPVSKN